MSSDAAFSPLNFPALPGSPADERAAIRGHAAGYAAGRKQVVRELDALRESIVLDGSARAQRQNDQLRSALDALGRATTEFRTRQQPALESVDAAITAAAIELAEVIVGRELASVDDSALAAVQRALREAPAGPAVVRLHPADHAVIVAAGPIGNLELVPDASIARGDAVLDLVDGSIDARVTTSFARARDALESGA